MFYLLNASYNPDNPHINMYWLLVALGILLLVEALIFAILLIRSKRKKKDHKVIGLTLDANGARRKFKVNDAFDTTGLVVTAHYNEEPLEEIITSFTVVTPKLIKDLEEQGKTLEDLEGCLVYAPDMSKNGDATVTVTYKGASAVYSITIGDTANANVNVNAQLPMMPMMPPCHCGYPMLPSIYNIYTAPQPQPTVCVVQL